MLWASSGLGSRPTARCAPLAWSPHPPELAPLHQINFVCWVIVFFVGFWVSVPRALEGRNARGFLVRRARVVAFQGCRVRTAARGLSILADLPPAAGVGHRPLRRRTRDPGRAAAHTRNVSLRDHGRTGCEQCQSLGQAMQLQPKGVNKPSSVQRVSRAVVAADEPDGRIAPRW
jgi:hypothetical protein